MVAHDDALGERFVSGQPDPATQLGMTCTGPLHRPLAPAPCTQTMPKISYPQFHWSQQNPSFPMKDNNDYVVLYTGSGRSPLNF